LAVSTDLAVSTGSKKNLAKKNILKNKKK